MQHRIKTIYTSLVESSLLYCCSVWSSVLRTKRGRKKLRAIEKHFNILKTKAFRTSDAGALSILSGSYPIDYRIIEITLKRLYLSYSPLSLPFSPSAKNTVLIHQNSITLPPQRIRTPPTLDHITGRNSRSTPTRTLSFPISAPQKPSVVKSCIKHHLLCEWGNEWEGAKSGLITKSFFPSPKCFLSLKSVSIPHQAIQIFTGHSLLNSHQHRFKLEDNPNCPCSGIAETIEHFLFICPLYTSQRTPLELICRRTIQIWPPPLHLFHKHNLAFKELIAFIICTKRLERMSHSNRVSILL